MVMLEGRSCRGNGVHLRNDVLVWVLPGHGVLPCDSKGFALIYLPGHAPLVYPSNMTVKCRGD
jgi:hypothetical protein